MAGFRPDTQIMGAGAETELEKRLQSLQEVANEQGIPQDTPVVQKMWSRVKKGGTTALKWLDKLNTPFYGISGILSGVGWKKGIEQRLEMDDVLLGEEYLSKKLNTAGAAKLATDIPEWILRFGINIVTNPVNYLFPATKGLYAAVNTGGKLVNINRTGIGLLDDLVQAKLSTQLSRGIELSDTALGALKREAYSEAREDLARFVVGRKNLVGKIISKTGEMLGGDKIPDVGSPSWDAFKTILSKLGIEPTTQNVNKYLNEGIPQLVANRAFKIISPIGQVEKEIFQWQPIYRKVAGAFRNNLNRTEAGRKILSTTDESLNFLREQGHEWFGLFTPRGVEPQEFQRFQYMMKSIGNENMRMIKENYLDKVDTLLAGLDKESFSKIPLALEKYRKFVKEGDGELAAKILNTLSDKEREVWDGVHQMFETMGQVEIQNGVLDDVINMYFPHIFKNKRQAQDYITKLRKYDLVDSSTWSSKTRVLDNIFDLPEDAINRLQPEWDLRKLITARVGSHYQVMTNKRVLDAIGKSDYAANFYGGFDIQKTQIPQVVRDRIVSQWNKIKIGEKAPSKLLGVLKYADDKLKTGSVSERPTTWEINDVYTKLVGVRKDMVRELKKNPTLKTSRDIARLEKKIGVVRDFLRNPDWEDITMRVRVKSVIPQVKDAKEVIKIARRTNPILSSKLLNMDDNSYVRFGQFISNLKTEGKLIPSEVLAASKNLKENIYVPQWVAREFVNSVNKSVFTNQAMREFFGGIRAANQIFKFGVTMPFPSFHFRNAVSDTLNSYMEMGFHAFFPRHYKEALDFSSGKLEKLVTELGEEVDVKQLSDEIIKYGIKGGFIAKLDIDKEEMLGLVSKIPVANKLLPAMIKFGGWREDTWRVSQYMFLRKRGFDPITAAAKVNRTMVDYAKMTNIEREVIGTMFPFYKWYKNNFLLHLEKATTETGRYAQLNTALHSLNDIWGSKKVAPEEERFLPLYIKNQPYVWMASKNNKEYYLHNFDLPLEQAFSMLPMEGALKTYLSLSAPWLKIPLEVATGVNFFKEQKIAEDYSGNQFKQFPAPIKDFLDYREVKKLDSDGNEYTVSTVDPYKKYLVNAISQLGGASRFLSGSNVADLVAIKSLFNFLKGEKVGYEDKAQLLHFISGVMIYEQDPNRDRARAEKELLDEYGEYLQRVGVVRSFREFYEDKRVKVTE